jgi:hypothetical protein
MSCQNIKPSKPIKCEPMKPLYGKLFLDMETGRVYDEFNNYIGIGKVVNGLLHVEQAAANNQLTNTNHNN